MRKISFEVGEYYHVYNRGVDKRSIVDDDYDSNRFVQALEEFNDIELIGSIYENSFRKSQLGSLAPKSKKLVNIICYCLNPNHFHLLLKQVATNGISRFMHKLGSGYTNYFNEKYGRSGGLFQGTFKAKHIGTNDYLQYLSAYVNLNNLGHQISGKASRLVRSSWREYIDGENKKSICDRKIILNQFKSIGEYQNYCTDTLPLVIENKKLSKELNDLGFEE